ncbi:MAG TPA: tRNA guanosine(15) transglycosylase TgtA [Geobacterales bacterium]|nr:tRNA guanosine(15) transglycosylase TgtA [Geobacterales bacterium]
MFFEILDKSLAARIGKIYTKSGYLETPALFPVIKVDFNPEIINHIKKLNFKSVITNAYLLWKKLKGDIVDIHEYLNFKNIIMTDSGGYQVLKYGDVSIRPKESLEYQIKIKSDIGVILDYPTGLSRDIEFVKKSVSLTLRRANFARRYLNNSETIIVAPIQGGTNYNLLKYCARRMKEMGYEMFALGSPTGLMEKYRYVDVLKMIMTVKSIVGDAAPLHLFGAGHPMIFPFIVACGIDTFDSAAYSLYAKDGRYLTRDRTYRLEDLSYLPCNCEVCRRMDPKDFLSLDLNKRIELLEKHNLNVSLEEIKHVKLHIKEGTLWNYLEQKARAHPSLYEAFMLMKGELEYFAEREPFTKVNIAGIFFFDPYSAIHPTLISYHRRLLETYFVNDEETLVIFPFLEEKPFSRSHFMKRFKDDLIKELGHAAIDRIRIAFIGYPFIFIPFELSEIYPASQWEGWIKNYPERKYLSKFLSGLLSKIKTKNFILFEDGRTKNLIKKIEDLIRAKGTADILKIYIKKDLNSAYLENMVSIMDFLKRRLHI